MKTHIQRSFVLAITALSLSAAPAMADGFDDCLAQNDNYPPYDSGLHGDNHWTRGDTGFWYGDEDGHTGECLPESSLVQEADYRCRGRAAHIDFFEPYRYDFGSGQFFGRIYMEYDCVSPRTVEATPL